MITKHRIALHLIRHSAVVRNDLPQSEHPQEATTARPVQLERIRTDDAAATSAAEGAAAAAERAQLSDALQLTTLQLENAALEADHLRKRVADVEAERDDVKRRVSGVGSFLLTCMDDVRHKVVELHDSAPEGGDAEIAVLPGARIPACSAR